MSDIFKIDRWSDEGWESGAPSLEMMTTALQVWSFLQQRPTSVAEAARVFNIEARRIVEAVNDNYWMFLRGPANDFAQLMIEHEGE